MADKIKGIRVKQSNGTYTQQIPISVNVQNVQWDENNHTLLDALGSVDISSSGKGNLQYQIDELDGDKISTNEFNSRLNNFLKDQISADTTDWLDNNVNPVGSTVIVDKTLTIEGAAADAKTVGDELTVVKADLDTVVKTVNGVEPDVSGNVVVNTGMGTDSNMIELLMTVLEEALYGTDQSDNLVSLNAALRGHTLVSISAVVNNVPIIGVSFSDVDFTVTATYSDESTATVTSYTVSEGTVAEGTNTATISFGGLTTTVAFMGSDTQTYTITYNLTGITSSNNTTIVAENSSYTATLSVMSGYTFSSCTITMGGVDVTSDVYSNMEILIGSVIGNVVITAAAGQIVYLDALKRATDSFTTLRCCSDESSTTARVTYTGGTVLVSEYPASSNCRINYNVTNNTESAISLDVVGIGMLVPSVFASEGNNKCIVSHWKAITNSGESLDPGASLTGYIDLLAGCQLAFTCVSNVSDGLTLELYGNYVADEFSDWESFDINSNTSNYGSYRTIKFYSDNGTTQIGARSSSNFKLISNSIEPGTYDLRAAIKAEYTVSDVLKNECYIGEVSSNTDTSADYSFASNVRMFTHIWFSGQITISSSGMSLIAESPYIHTLTDSSMLVIKIKEAS